MKLILGDCVEKMRELPMESVDAIVTDPPYDLTSGKKGGSGIKSVNLDSPYGRSRISTGNGGFMGKDWDSTGVAFDPATWTEALRSLKPGGYLLAFGGTRTYHRLTCAIEDAAFEIRDCMMWLYGQGFPKSLNLPGGLGTALKPAWEPIVVARKPVEGTVEENVTCYGTGAMNIEDSRVAGAEPRSYPNGPGGKSHHYSSDKRSEEVRPEPWSSNDLGRWPANLLLTHHPDCVQTGTVMAPGRSMNRYTDGLKPFGGGKGHPSRQEKLPNETVEVWDCHQDCPIRIMDEQTGERKGGAPVNNRPGGGYNEGWGSSSHPGYEDVGGASRFFYCAKVTTTERNAGVDDENQHPTVKPIDLMRYLTRLVVPADGVVLDPFMGSGSTGIAALLEKRTFIGIEREPDYMRVAKQRIQYWQQHGEDGWRIAAEKEAAENRRERILASGQLDLMEML